MSNFTISKDFFQEALQAAMGSNTNEEQKEVLEHTEEKPMGNTVENFTDEKEKLPNISLEMGIREEASKNVETEKEKLTEIVLEVVDEKLENKMSQSTKNEEQIMHKSSLDGDVPQFSLANFLTNVLTQLKMPVSVSFINLFLNGIQQAPINELFVRCKENQDKFSFFLLGNDFKISVKEVVDKGTRLSAYENNLIEIIQKDTTRLRELKGKLDKKNIVEVSYTDFINEYSTNKCKMNLSFIVRNSHVLKISNQDNNTYIRYINEDQQVTSMWDMNNGLDAVLLKCVKQLLSHFTSLHQSLLNFFNFGPDCVVNKRFLNKYHDVFDVTGNTVITLKHSGEPKRTSSNTIREHSISNSTSVYPQKTNICTTEGSKNVSEETEKTKDNTEIVDIAVSKKRSIIVIGAGESIPVIYYEDSNYSDKLSALEKLSKFIDREIEKISK